MALYNRYRPRKLSEVLGQEIDIFRAICDNPDAYNAIILAGPPGTGKTLLAHMYSKYINCLAKEKPCGVCENCKLDDTVIETDAAVQNGVDNIRDLITSVNYLPLKLKYQVYVLDEAHMLSPLAKEALLLMLHNPPAHVKIIFATTAIEKLPDTFVSRCTVFRLFRLSNNNILKILENICVSEKKKVDSKILQLIVDKSDGSARKAISLLDPILLANNISIETAKHYMNILDRGVCVEIIRKCLNQELTEAINIWENLATSGYNEKVLIHGLLEVINDLYLSKANHHVENDCLPILAEYQISNGWLANTFDILCKALTYLYQINGPSVKIPSILMMISTVQGETTLSGAIKKAFANDIAANPFTKT